ncbi:uncharacterized protein [Pyxicephalus adspersus]|uniref:uncharacterized protein n=1 Tax=Pyxicephalus adspersus TaxID=30357 RepID=UPI003B5993D5
MTTSIKMEKMRSHMAERILDLTLEIIYLLTGEDYELVKKTSEEQNTTINHRHVWSSPHCSTPERNKKILNVVNKITELLTGEPEEQLYVKVEVKEEVEETSVMDYPQSMEKVGMVATVKQEEPSLDISTDGSSNGNPPERCPRPLYSGDSTQEIPQPQHEEQIYIEVKIKEEEEETPVRGGLQATGEARMMVATEEQESSLDSIIGVQWQLKDLQT